MLIPFQDFYEASLGRGPGRAASLPFYLTPPKRFVPGTVTAREGREGRELSPRCRFPVLKFCRASPLLCLQQDADVEIHRRGLRLLFPSRGWGSAAASRLLVHHRPKRRPTPFASRLSIRGHLTSCQRTKEKSHMYVCHYCCTVAVHSLADETTLQVYVLQPGGIQVEREELGAENVPFQHLLVHSPRRQRRHVQGVQVRCLGYTVTISALLMCARNVGFLE